MKHKRFLVGMFGLLFLIVKPALPQAEVKILVIPKGTETVYWSNVAAGAQKAGQELDLAVTFRGPRSESQHEAQLKIIEYGIREKFAAIVLAPNHVTAATQHLKRAVAKEIAIVLIDSNMECQCHSSFIESDNYAAGRRAAHHIDALMGGTGTVGLIRYQAESASTREREAGFSDTLSAKHPQIKIVAGPWGGTSVGAAYHTVLKMLDEHPQIEAIFSVNEPMTLGTLKALTEMGLSNRIRFIGFDLNPTIRDAILEHKMDATIAQDPYQIGYLGVKTAHRLIENRPVAEKIYTDTVLITAENIHSEVVRQFIRANIK